MSAIQWGKRQIAIQMKMVSFFLLSLFLFTYLDADEKNDFDTLMGQQTKHWHFVSHSSDIDFLFFAKKIYEKNKTAQFTTVGVYKIPPVIHFIWLGPKQFPPESVENVRTWIAQNSHWTVKFWTDRNRDPPCTGMQVMHVKDFSFLKLGNCFKESENWGEKSDILRYEILYKEGGVYVDHDANCLKPFDGMHKGYDFYCGLEAPHEPFAGKNITCGNGVIASRPGHPVVAKVIELIANRWEDLKYQFRGKDPYSKVEIVMHRTYIALTHALVDTIDRENNVDIVFPSAYFFAKSGIISLYSKHFYATSWDDFHQKTNDSACILEKTFNKLMHVSRTITWYLSILIGFNLFLIGFLLDLLLT